MTAPLINLSGSKGVEAAAAAILKIMDSKADQKTIRLAIKAIRKAVTPGPTSISHCTFTVGQSPDAPTKPEFPFTKKRTAQ